VEELLRKILKKAKGYDTEVSSVKDITTSVNFKSGKCDSASESNVSSMGIRVTKNGKSGYSVINNLEEWEGCLKRAKRISKLSKKSEFYGLNSKRKSKKVKLFSKKLNNIYAQDLKKHGKDIVSSVKSRVVGLNIEKASTKLFYANSNGAFFEQEKQGVGFGIDLKHKSNVFYEEHSSVKDLDFVDFAKRADGFCMVKGKKHKITTGKYPVLFDYFAVSDLLSIVSPHFSMNSINKGKSIFANNIGNKVFSKNITLHDQGNLDFGNNSMRFDLEGTPSQKTTLVNKGILKGFLSDRTSGKGKSTSNCLSLSSRPSVSKTNLILSKGRDKFNDFIDNFSGIHIISLMGTHTSNLISGDFSLNVINAFKVQKGKIMPLKNFMVSGNAFETFKRASNLLRENRQVRGNICSPIFVDEVDII